MSVPATRRLVVLLVAWAIVSLQLVHVDHIHPAGLEGRTRSLVHSHPIAVATTGEAWMVASHGDHLLAIFLAPIYESAHRNLFDCGFHDIALPHVPNDLVPRFHAAGVVQQASARQAPGATAGALQGRAPPLA